MAKSCVLAPNRGVKTFNKLKKTLGYNKAWNIYGIAIDSQFQQDYKDSLILDDEGIPSFESLINNEYIKQKLSKQDNINILQENFKEREDTIANYKTCLEECKNFNKEHSEYTAIVENTENGIKSTVLENNEQNKNLFKNQYASFTLNEKLARQLNKFGVKIEDLSLVEYEAGREGVISFESASRVAKDVVATVRRANNMAGHNAISEEFSHLIIRAMSDNPLIQRALNILQKNEDLVKSLLGEEYETLQEYYKGFSNANEFIAEEALGQLLRQNLLEQNIEGLNSSLFNRLCKQIVSQFKDVDAQAIIEALIEANNLMSEVAQNVVKATALTENQIKNAQRESISFNSLRSDIETNLDILKKASLVEAKKTKLFASTEGKNMYKILQNLLDSTDENVILKGIFDYTENAVDELSNVYEKFKDIINYEADDLGAICHTLRMGRLILTSYTPFITDLNNLVNANVDNIKEAEEYTVTKVNEETKEETTVSLSQLLSKLNSLNSLVSSRYTQLSVEAFAKFVTPITGDIIQLDPKNPNSKVTIQELLKKATSDISVFDMWLDSMGTSSDIMLRVLDKIVKNAKDKAREETITSIKEIQTLMQEFKQAGITNYEWMFEVDKNGKKTGNYITKYNVGQYQQDEKEFLDSLNEKYGKIAKGENAKKKIAERIAWYDSHSTTQKIFTSSNTFIVKRVPNDKYLNKAYTSLSETQLNLLKKFFNLKSSLDKYYPNNETVLTKALQIRKDNIQRFFNSLASPSSIVDNIKRNITASLTEQNDDINLFGANYRTSLTDFEGREVSVLPHLYNTMLDNTDELSTDVFKTLMMYASAAHDYDKLSGIIEQLELGRNVLHNRKVLATRGSSTVKEVLNINGVKTVVDSVLPLSSTNIDKKIDDFLDSQVYGKHLHDSGYTELFGTKFNRNKVVTALLKTCSMAQMGFNWLANIANVTTGIAMQNIEAAACQYFTPKTLASADAEYIKLIQGYLGEINSNIKTNKLALFDELFDVRQDFKGNLATSKNSNAFKRLFGKSLAYLGQECGDHWLYNRTAIAMCKNQKIYQNGKEVGTLWDALKIRDFNNQGIKEMYIDGDYTDENGNKITATSFARKIAHINQTLFGVYNEEDKEMAQRVILGRLCLQYRKWIKPQFNRRFMKNQFNYDLNEYEEGYYRTMGRFIVDLIKGRDALGVAWGNLNKNEKANMKRGITEILQFMAVWCFANLIEWPDDDEDKAWYLKMTEYIAQRSTHELGNLTPSLTMANELLSTVKSPMPCLSAINNTLKFTWAAVNPPMWFDEKQSGAFEGHSTLYSRFWKLPIPIISQYNSLDRFFNDLDNSIQFYSRSTN